MRPTSASSAACSSVVSSDSAPAPNDTSPGRPCAMTWIASRSALPLTARTICRGAGSSSESRIGSTWGEMPASNVPRSSTLRSMNAIARFNVRGDMAFSLYNFASLRQPAPQLALGESRSLKRLLVASPPSKDLFISVKRLFIAAMDEHEVVFQGKQSTRPQRSWTVRHEHGLQSSPVNCTFLDNRKRRRKFVCTMRLRAPPITLETSTLAGWVGATAAAMAPLVEVLRCDAIGGSDVLHGDDTPVSVLAPGAGKTKSTTGGVLLLFSRPQRRATGRTSKGLHRSAPRRRFGFP